MGWFSDEADLEAWTDKSKLPPASWLSKAKDYHAFMYKMTMAQGNAATCRVQNKRTKKWKNVYCDQEYNRPQPLSNVVNALVDLSK